ncbi:hypothetical protein JCM3766R1_006318 [Sporobolomyces carnicolor]
MSSRVPARIPLVHSSLSRDRTYDNVDPGIPTSSASGLEATQAVMDERERSDGDDEDDEDLGEKAELVTRRRGNTFRTTQSASRKRQSRVMRSGAKPSARLQAAANSDFLTATFAVIIVVIAGVCGYYLYASGTLDKWLESAGLKGSASSSAGTVAQGSGAGSTPKSTAATTNGSASSSSSKANSSVSSSSPAAGAGNSTESGTSEKPEGSETGGSSKGASETGKSSGGVGESGAVTLETITTMISGSVTETWTGHFSTSTGSSTTVTTFITGTGAAAAKETGKEEEKETPGAASGPDKSTQGGEKPRETL